jgi:hypothetical protein
MMGTKLRTFAPQIDLSLEELVPQDHFYRLCWLHSTTVLKRHSFFLEFRRCHPSFPAFLLGSHSPKEGHGCSDHDVLCACSPSAIRLLSGCGRLSPAMLLSISEAVFRCAGHSTFDIRS